MWTSSLYLVCFAGPTIAGYLVEWYDFRITTILFWASYLVLFVVDFIECGYFFKTGAHRQNTGYQQLH